MYLSFLFLNFPLDLKTAPYFSYFSLFDHLPTWENKKLISNKIWYNSTFSLLFYQIEPLKNGVSLILPSSIARNSSAPNAKRIFEILWGILEGRTNSARPFRPCLKNCQNGTFWSVHGIWIFFGLNDYIWGASKVPFSDFIQKMSQALFSSVQVIIWEDKLDYLKNPSKDLKKFFWFLWVPSNIGRQN